MSSHTPGPWEITGPNVRESKSRGLLFVQSCPFADAEPDADEQDANRKLVAAAPDLLLAAKAFLAVLENVDFSPLTDGTYDQIPWAALEQAIAKTEGREAPTNDQPPSFYRTWFKDCATGNHQCYDENQICGCWCKDCIDLTEPRCPRCNSILEKGVCPDYQDCVPLTEGREE